MPVPVSVPTWHPRGPRVLHKPWACGKGVTRGVAVPEERGHVQKGVTVSPGACPCPRGVSEC